jgi:hypothetical protein
MAWIPYRVDPMERATVICNRWNHWWLQRTKTKLNGWLLGHEVTQNERIRLASRCLGATAKILGFMCPAFMYRLGLTWADIGVEVVYQDHDSIHLKGQDNGSQE